MIFPFIVSIFLGSLSLASVNDAKFKGRAFWSEFKIASIINKLEKVSLGYEASIYTELLKQSIQSMIFYNPRGVLEVVVKRSLLFNVFFWALLGGSLDACKFPPERNRTSKSRDDILRLRTADALSSIKGEIHSGSVPDDEISHKIIASMEGIETRLAAMTSEV